MYIDLKIYKWYKSLCLRKLSLFYCGGCSVNLYVKILKQEHGTFYVAKRDGVKLGVFASIDEALERMALEKPLPPKLKCPVNIWQSKKFYWA